MERKKLFTLIAVISVALLLLGSFLTACSSSTPAPTTTAPTTSAPAASTSAPATTSAPTTTQAAVKPIELRVPVWTTDVKSAERESIKWWADEVQKRANGKVKITLYFGESLVKNMEHLESLRLGTIDMAWMVRGYFPAEFPLSAVGDGAVKFHYASGPATIMAMWQMIQEFPEIQNEFKAQNLKPLIPLGIGSSQIVSNKMIQSMTDMKGVKIRGAGSIFPKLFSAVGAVPVSMAATELYDAFSKGILDATSADLGAINRYKLYEVAKYRIMIEFGAVPSVMLCANQDVWNKLPADVQKIMVDIRPEAFDVFSKIHYGEVAEVEKLCKDKGMQFIPFPAAEAEKWRTSEGVTKLAGEWVADMNNKKLPGQKVLDRWLALETEMEAAYGPNGTHWK
jgi:TRAP-type transport system periplasmic protein